MLGLLPSPRAVQAVRDLYAYLLGYYLPRRYPSLFELVTQQGPTASDGGEKVGEELEGVVVFRNKVTGLTAPISPLPEDPVEMLRVLGETVEDDLFLVLRDDDEFGTAVDGSHGHSHDQGHGPRPREHRAVAFVCCHPAGFNPAEKLGKRLVEIHGPVPAYEKIAASMERFFGRLEVGRPVKRVNVS